MNDLQRIIECIWNIVRAEFQDGSRNSDSAASAAFIPSGKLSPFGPVREFYSG
jgi:hypothetical protein